MENIKVQEIYDYAIKLTKEAGVIMWEGFYGEKDTVMKSDRIWDLVTKQDKQIEQLLMDRISSKYPDHKFIGEETSAKYNFTPDLTDDPTWIIDPIDGTINYISGFPHTAISLALTIQKELVIGIVYNPMLNELFHARKDHGAFLNDQRITASKVEHIKEALISHEVMLASIPQKRDKNIARFLNVVSKCRGIRCIGCAAVDLAYTAKGIFDGYHVDDLKIWDLAAGVLLVREAGGVVYAPDGGEFNIMKPNLVCAGTEKLCQELIELIRYEEENK